MAGMRATPRLLVLAVLTAALAGCTDNKAPSAEPEANFEDLGLQASDTTGILRGVVIDEAIRPIADVRITITTGTFNRSMDTKADGLFGFDGLQPGDYFVTASKAGFTTMQSSGQVVAGVKEPTAIKIQLTADPSTAPYIQSQHLNGFITCSVRGMIIAYQCGVGAEDVVNDEYDLTAIPEWIQSEMTWQSTQATGDELSLSIRCLVNSARCPDGQLTIVRSEGKSPQIATINRTVAEFWALGAPDGDPLSISIFAFGRSDLDVYDEETVDSTQEPITGKPCLDWSGVIFPAGTCIRATGPGLIINQKVDVYTHIFYGFLPIEGWTFGEDGEHPLPP